MNVPTSGTRDEVCGEREAGSGAAVPLEGGETSRGCLACFADESLQVVADFRSRPGRQLDRSPGAQSVDWRVVVRRRGDRGAAGRRQRRPVDSRRVGINGYFNRGRGQLCALIGLLRGVALGHAARDDDGEGCCEPSCQEQRHREVSTKGREQQTSPRFATPEAVVELGSNPRECSRQPSTHRTWPQIQGLSHLRCAFPDEEAADDDVSILFAQRVQGGADGLENAAPVQLLVCGAGCVWQFQLPRVGAPPRTPPAIHQVQSPRDDPQPRASRPRGVGGFLLAASHVS